MRLAAAAVTLLLLTGPAFAQPAMNLWQDDKKKDPDAVARQEEIDKAYREKTKSQAAPVQAPSDPWGNVRASETPAKSKTQTGSKKQ